MRVHPAYLWIGRHAEMSKRARDFVKQVLCKNNACDNCADCRNIDANRHYAVMTLAPENYYTVSQLEPVLRALSFSLQPDEHQFFIFEQAHLFNLATANSLLKSLEEPPAGYHFILLAPRTEGILPTIRSRCIVEQFSTPSSQERHPLFRFFTEVPFPDPVLFIQELEKNKIPEAELLEFLDDLALFWQETLKQAYAKNDTLLARRASLINDILSDLRVSPPMPGSSKLFLKNLFLRCTLAFDSVFLLT